MLDCANVTSGGLGQTLPVPLIDSFTSSGDCANCACPSYLPRKRSRDACACQVGVVPVGDDSGTFPTGTVVSTQVGQSGTKVNSTMVARRLSSSVVVVAYVAIEHGI